MKRTHIKEFIQRWLGKYGDELIILLIWVVAVLIINPIGEFPLNDDWAYSLDVFHLSEEGKLILSDWPAMTLIAQIIWGAFVTSVFGFSFTALRISTIVVGFFAVLGFYRILQTATLNKTSSRIGTLLFMFTPLFFVNVYTFMTEVYFICALNFSILFLTRFYQTDKKQFLWAGSFFVLLSTMIRQPGIAIGLAFAVVYLFNKKLAFKRVLFAFLPVVVASVALFSYTSWLRQSGQVTNFSDFGILIRQLTEAPVGFYLNRFGIVALYFGLFSLPISILLVPKVLKKYGWIEKGAILLLVALGLTTKLLDSFPAGNVVYNLGLGPKLLKDAYWGDNVHPQLSETPFYILKLFALLSAAIVVVVVFRELILGSIRFLRKQESSSARFLRSFSMLFFSVYFAFILINPIFFDRYILPCIASFFIAILPIKPLTQRLVHIISLTFVSLYIFFSIGATHDYLSWNKARWEALDYLTNELKIKQTKIDGGFEFNSWYQTSGFSPGIRGRKSWWRVAEDDYVVSFGEIDGFKLMKKVGYKNWLQFGRDSIYILEKDESQKLILSSLLQCDCERRGGENLYFLDKECDNVEFTGGQMMSDKEALSGVHSIKFDAENSFGLLIRIPDIRKNEQFIVRVWRKGIGIKAGVVMSTEPGELYYKFNNQTSGDSLGWSLIQSEMIVPKECDGLTLAVYLWNPGQDSVWFDDLTIERSSRSSN